MEATQPHCPTCGDDPTLGYEYAGIYDGVLIWEDAAGHRWPRFTHGRLHDEAHIILNP